MDWFEEYCLNMHRDYLKWMIEKYQSDELMWVEVEELLSKRERDLLVRNVISARSSDHQFKVALKEIPELKIYEKMRKETEEQIGFNGRDVSGSNLGNKVVEYAEYLLSFETYPNITGIYLFQQAWRLANPWIPKKYYVKGLFEYYFKLNPTYERRWPRPSGVPFNEDVAKDARIHGLEELVLEIEIQLGLTTIVRNDEPCGHPYEQYENDPIAVATAEAKREATWTAWNSFALKRWHEMYPNTPYPTDRMYEGQRDRNLVAKLLYCTQPPLVLTYYFPGWPEYQLPK